MAGLSLQGTPPVTPGVGPGICMFHPPARSRRRAGLTFGNLCKHSGGRARLPFRGVGSPDPARGRPQTRPARPASRLAGPASEGFRSASLQPPGRGSPGDTGGLWGPGGGELMNCPPGKLNCTSFSNLSFPSEAPGCQGSSAASNQRAGSGVQ